MVDDISKQNYKKKWCDDDYFSFKLITPLDRLLPFQIIRPSRPNEIVSWYIYGVDNPCVQDLLALEYGECTYRGGLFIKTCGEVDYIINNGKCAFSDTFGCGFYYSEISDGVQTWYSEVFYMADIGTVDESGLEWSEGQLIKYDNSNIIKYL
jgi:hypothetical protein